MDCLRVDYLGTHLYIGIDLDQQGEKLTGKFGSDALEGSTDGSSFHFLAQDKDGRTEQAKGNIQGGALHGEVIETDPNVSAHPATYTFIATLRPPRPTAPSRRHEFTPTVFYRQFSPFNQPVLTVNPGDTVHTTTVDAGGTDHDNVRRVLGSNPQSVVERARIVKVVCQFGREGYARPRQVRCQTERQSTRQNNTITRL